MKKGRLITPIYTQGNDGDIVEIYTSQEVVDNFDVDDGLIEYMNEMDLHHSDIVGFVKSNHYRDDFHTFIGLDYLEVEILKEV